MQLLGRDALLRELGTMFDEGARLVTLVGAGGIGKTALALALSQSKRGIFVDLTEAVSDNGVASKLALALGAPLGDGEAVETLAEAAPSGALLVLDNCEQASAPVGRLLDALLKARPDLLFVATSRERLELEDERVVPLPLLDDESAVALLRERGQRARPGFVIEDEALATQIVRRLDHLPLAIELAAARLEVMSLEQLDARTDDQLRLLKKPGKREDRHDTLRATIAWSWDLLDDDGRAALAQCALFRDGFTLESFEAVVGIAGFAEDALQDLKRKSLLLAERRGGGMRFRLLESVRAFASEQLQSGGLDEAEARFVTWFAPPLAEPRPWKALDVEGCAQLRAEVENLLEAMKRGDAVARACVAQELDRFFAHEGPVDVHFRILDEGVAAAEESADPALLARLLLTRGEAHRRRSHLEETRADLARAATVATGELAIELDLRVALTHMIAGEMDEALALAERVLSSSRGASARTLGLAHGLSGTLKLFFGEDDGGGPALERALPYFREARDDRFVGITLANLGVVHLDQADHEGARARFDEAAEIFGAINESFIFSSLQLNRALCSLDLGELDLARTQLDETLRLCRRSGARGLAAHAQMCIGVASHLEGDLDEARANLVWAIERAEDSRETGTIGAANAHLALVQHRQGQDPAACLARAKEIAADYPAAWLTRLTEVVHAIIEDADFDEVEDRPAQVRITKSLRRQAPRAQISIGPDARWLELPEVERQDLSRRGPLRRILLELAAAHARGDALSVEQLVEAGWPGEKMHAESGAARVYAAVRTLRKLGLEPYLTTRDDGYLLDPGVEVVSPS